MNLPRSLLMLLFVATAGCPGPKPPPPEARFTFTVDPALAPAQAALAPRADGAPRPVATLRDEAGVQSDFVENELLVYPKSDAELTAFLARRKAVVLSDSELVLAAALPGVPLAPHVRQVAVRVGQPADTAALGADATAAGVTGAFAFSSEAGAQVVATAAAEVAGGLKVAPNFVAASTGMLRSTKEMVVGQGWADGFGWAPFNGALAGVKNHSTVVGAWQYLEARGYSPRSVKVAILDSGFWLDSNGSPFDLGDGTDLPAHPDQFNVHTMSVNAGGANYGSCTGNSPCPWHGNGSAGVATGLMNNLKGAVGTGGQVASPLLLDLDNSDGEVIDALQIARLAGARVVNMSFGGSCNALCRTWRDDITSYGSTIADTLNAGVVLVAAAGNDAANLDLTPYYPCAEPRVICVGALGTRVTNKPDVFDTNAIDYSNYGAAIAIWAPTDVPVMPNGTTQTTLALHNGTSASSPFVAGVVAMMIAVNPGLEATTVRAMLQQTAFTGSTDPKVKQVLDARRALMVAGDNLPPDAFEPNQTAQTATALAPGNYHDLSIHKPGDVDVYRLTLPDYAKVTLYLDTLTQGFAPLNVQLTPESAGGQPLGLVEGHDANGYHYFAALASPGTYLLQVSGSVQPYELWWQADPQPLSPDAWEVNDSAATAAQLWRAFDTLSPNFHVSGDVDFFRFQVSGVPDADHYFRVSLVDADVPVLMDLYDDAGTYLRSSSTGFFAFQAVDNLQHFIVRFANQNGGRGRYSFSYGAYALPTLIPPFISQGVLQFLDPSDPSPFGRVLIGVDEWSALVPVRDTPGGVPAGKLALDSAQLHLTLVDGAGAVGAQGQAQPATATGAGGELLSFGGVTTAGQTYYLHVTRTDALSVARIAYQLQFTN